MRLVVPSRVLVLPLALYNLLFFVRYGKYGYGC